MADIVQTKPKKKKKIVIIVIAIIAVAAVGIGIMIKNAAKTVETTANTVEVEPVATP